MNKVLLVPVLVLLSVTQARAQAMEPPGPRPLVGERPEHVLWVAPVMHGFFAVMGPPMGDMVHLALPVGLNRKLSDQSDLVLEVTPRYSRRRCGEDVDSCGTVRSLTVSTGLAWRPWARVRGNGFFLQPKLSGMVLNERDRPEAGEGDTTNRSSTGGQLTLGLDMGFQKTTASNFYLAFVFGAGVGYSWNQRRDVVDLGARYNLPWGSSRKSGGIVDINLDLLRLGFGF
ncbi:hypothetical protein JYK02_09475 [Corallococcus macrosporus]|uniref:Outer membrane protein beta-barrel domain-containing protein n=1 Tax=Corallococcus macrosporus TaxID=35 RepID=A0ABS3D7U1_9BACT|nr:hypothetical protein [Corallococcus macrosporus]MBN8227738.1 hypothetical protein [Corallococcus macrosporus]